MFKRTIGIIPLKNYQLVSVINKPDGNFFLIYMDKTNLNPAIFADVKYITEGKTKVFTMFKAAPANNATRLSKSADDFLEIESINTTEEIRGCMYANSVTIET